MSFDIPKLHDDLFRTTRTWSRQDSRRCMAAPLCGSAGAPAATSPAETPCNKKTFYLLNIFFKWPIHNSHATVRNAHLGITPIQCRYTAEYRYLIVSNFQNIGKNLLNLEFLLKTAWKGSGTQKLLIIIRKYRKKG